jgi:hypothetical protein
VPPSTSTDWSNYGWVYLFAALIGFATTIAEPSLIAVAFKAREVSGGSINPWGLRVTVAVGVAFGISLGTFASSPARRSTSISWPVTWWCWCRPVSPRKRSWPLPTIPAA